MKRIAIFGSTGSIGVNTLKVISRHPDKFRVTALSCDSNYKLLSKQARIFKPDMLALKDASKIKDLRKTLRPNVKIFDGAEGLAEMAKLVRADIALIAISGNASLMPLINAIRSRKTIALASKEPLVSAGEIVMKEAHRRRVSIIPVDSEHSAIFQCLKGHNRKELKKIYLTGTGGPLRLVGKRLFDKLPTSKILAHPKWKMGKKISVDSATLMNKGLEVIEARWLFDVNLKNIEVLVHPEAVVHSMVEFIDGSLLAQLAIPDMKLPIQYALNFPERLSSNNFRMNINTLRSLTFHKPDTKKFPCLGLAYEALRRGRTYPAALNAANEEAVNMYLTGMLKFTSIPRVIEKVLNTHKGKKIYSLKDIISVDRWAREEVKSIRGSYRC